jgi:exosortase
VNGNLTETNLPGFWPDATACWQRLPNKLFFFTLLAAWLAVFHFYGNSILGYVNSPSIFAYLNDAYNTSSESDDGYGNLIPFVVVGLFWWKRKELLALPLQPWWPAIFIVLLGALIHYAGFAVQQPRFSLVGMFTGIFGLMGLAWGRAWLWHSLFPFWLFVFSVPLAALLLPLTFPLRLIVTFLAWLVSNLLTFDVARAGTQLIGHGGKYQYDVAAACSGMKSLVSIFLLATVYGCILFRSLKKRLLLMALALPLSILGNFLRLMCIILAAEFGGQDWGNYVHEGCPFHLPGFGEVALVNLLPYVPAFLGLFWAGNWLEKKYGKENP